MEARISFTEDRSIQRIFPLNRVNYDSLPDFVPPYFREMGRPVARSISTDRLIGLKVGRNWSSIIASSLFLSPFSKNCSKVNGCLGCVVGARCPAFQLINETRRAGVESRGGGMENQERAAVILG